MICCPECFSTHLTLAHNTCCYRDLDDVDADDIECDLWQDCVPLFETSDNYQVFCEDCGWEHDFAAWPGLDDLLSVLSKTDLAKTTT